MKNTFNFNFTNANANKFAAKKFAGMFGATKKFYGSHSIQGVQEV